MAAVSSQMSVLNFSPEVQQHVDDCTQGRPIAIPSNELMLVSIRCIGFYFFIDSHENVFVHFFDEEAVFQTSLRKDTLSQYMYNFSVGRNLYTYIFKDEIPIVLEIQFCDEAVNTIRIQKFPLEKCVQKEFILNEDKAQEIGENGFFASSDINLFYVYSKVLEDGFLTTKVHPVLLRDDPTKLVCLYVHSLFPFCEKLNTIVRQAIVVGTASSLVIYDQKIYSLICTKDTQNDVVFFECQLKTVAEYLHEKRIVDFPVEEMQLQQPVLAKKLSRCLNSLKEEYFVTSVREGRPKTFFKKLFKIFLSNGVGLQFQIHPIRIPLGQYLLDTPIIAMLTLEVQRCIAKDAQKTIWSVTKFGCAQKTVVSLIANATEAEGTVLWNEYLVHSHLQHRNILKIRKHVVQNIPYFSGVERPIAREEFLQTEFFDGGTCQGWEHSVPTSETVLEDRRKALIEASCGMEYVHRNGFVLMNFNPAQLFRKQEGGTIVTKLGTFALKMPYEVTEPMPFFGDFESMREPSGQCFAHQAYDVWSLGITAVNFLYSVSKNPMAGTVVQFDENYQKLVAMLAADSEAHPSHKNFNEILLEMLTKLRVHRASLNDSFLRRFAKSLRDWRVS